MARLANKSILLIVTSMAILLASGYWAGALWHRQSRDAVGAWAPRFTPSVAHSDVYNESAGWVLNDVARMSEPWTPEIAARLAEMLRGGYSETYIEEVATRSGATLADQEPLMLYGYAQSVVAERLHRGEPIDPEARKSLVLALLDSLRHPHWRIRLGAVQAVCYARLVEDETIRLLVIAMFNDPHPEVAANARRQLAHYDEIGRLREPGS